MPTVYTSTIGEGPGADYPTIAAWYTASAGAGYYEDGDEIIALLQSSATGHNASNTAPDPPYHDIAGTQHAWPEDKEITITFSSTKLAGSGPPDGWLRVGNGFNSVVFQSSAASKTINFKNLDIEMHEGSTVINRDLTLTDNAPTQVNYDTCRISGVDGNRVLNRVGSTVGGGNATSGVVTFTYTNCLIRALTIVRQEVNGFSKCVCNLIGCVLSNSNRFPSFYPNGSTTGIGNSTFEVHFSGVISNWAYQEIAGMNQYNGVVISGVPQYSSGTATDYLSNEPDTYLNLWADVRTNVSGDQTFVYGSAPGTADIAFLGNNIQTYTDFSSVFTNDVGDDNLRLWDSTDNAASGFVSNVTLPSPDLAGHDRGSTPFDAGPYEISFIPGGGGSSNENLSLVLVSVNLYN